ncbi:unnamed protein product [Lasius platythorax]
MNNTTRLLSDWEFSAEVIANFTAQEIEIDQFNILTEEDLKSLIPNIGPRRKFQNNVKKYLNESYTQEKLIRKTDHQQPSQQECVNIDIENTKTSETEHQNLNATTENTEQQTFNTDNISDNSSVRSTPKSHITTPGPSGESLANTQPSGSGVKRRLISDDEYDLETVLKKSEEGQFVLGIYKNEGKLNNDIRNKLAKIIVSHELSPNINYNINSSRASFLSDHVKKLFPTEEKSVWYIKNQKGESQGKGKIFTKYYSTRRKLIKAGLISAKASTINNKFCLNELSDDDIDEYEEYLLWLKNNSNPWHKVTEYWSFTSKKRLKTFVTNNQSCHEYMDHFPAFSDSLGYLLLEQDFETLHPECNLKLYVAWPKLSDFICNKISSKAKSRLNHVFTPDGIKVATLSLMPHLFPVITIKKGKPKDWRPSREESEEAFLLHVKTIADLKIRLEERTTKLKSFGLTSQPIAVIVGPTFDEINQCFVCINQLRYEVETPLKAVDLVFKSCNALNIQYPPEVGQLFMFLQRAIYNFETVWDKQKNSQLTTSVLAVIQEYKSL